MRQNKKNKGFTLVELLIVVAIIGILAAVLTPQFLNARKVAAQRAAEAYAHNVYTAVQAHIAQTGEFTINQTTCTAGWDNTGSGSGSTLFPVPKPEGLTFATSNGCVIAVDSTESTVSVTVNITDGTGDEISIGN